MLEHRRAIRAEDVDHSQPRIAGVTLHMHMADHEIPVDEGAMDATILALAGLKRLGRADVATDILDPADFLTAPGQGAIALEGRENDDRARETLAAINHPATSIALKAERAFLEILDGSCRTPIAALAELSGPSLRLRGLVASLDGSAVDRIERTGAAADCAALGAEAGRDLRSRLAPGYFAPQA